MEPVDQLSAEEAGTTVSVHAGFPNPAAERTGTPLSLDRLLIKHPSSSYFFRIRGHNWFRYGVFDGDIALIDRAYEPRPQDLVVWWESSGSFRMSRYDRAHTENVWGIITAIVHPFRGAAVNDKL